MTVLILFTLYLALRPARDRYQHWRGPQMGDRDTVEGNHLWYFSEPEATEWEYGDE